MVILVIVVFIVVAIDIGISAWDIRLWHQLDKRNKELNAKTPPYNEIMPKAAKLLVWDILDECVTEDSNSGLTVLNERGAKKLVDDVVDALV